MDYIGIQNCLFQRTLVLFRNDHAVFLYISVQRFSEIVSRDNIIPVCSLFILIGTYNANIVSLCTQAPDQIHACNGCAVVFLSQHIRYDDNCHIFSSLL